MRGNASCVDAPATIAASNAVLPCFAPSHHPAPARRPTNHPVAPAVQPSNNSLLFDHRHSSFTSLPSFFVYSVLPFVRYLRPRTLSDPLPRLPNTGSAKLLLRTNSACIAKSQTASYPHWIHVRRPLQPLRERTSDCELLPFHFSLPLTLFQSPCLRSFNQLSIINRESLSVRRSCDPQCPSWNRKPTSSGLIARDQSLASRSAATRVLRQPSRPSATP